MTMPVHDVVEKFSYAVFEREKRMVSSCAAKSSPPYALPLNVVLWVTP